MTKYHVGQKYLPQFLRYLLWSSLAFMLDSQQANGLAVWAPSNAFGSRYVFLYILTIEPKSLFLPGNCLHQIIYSYFLNFFATLPSWCSAHVSRDGLHLNAVHHRSGSSSIAASSSSQLSASYHLLLHPHHQQQKIFNIILTASSSSTASFHLALLCTYFGQKRKSVEHLNGMGFPWLVDY